MLDYPPISPRYSPSPPPPTMAQAVWPVVAFAGLLWLIHGVDVLFFDQGSKPGIYPRSAIGLVGIVLAPLVHDSFGHLVANTLPLLLLAGGVRYMYPRAAPLVFPLLYLVPGVGVWLFARAAWHIGASGFTYGLMFFLVIIGMLRKDRTSVGISMAVLFLYGGMLLGLLPEDSHISFEYHLFGALSGVLCAVALRHRDAPAPTPTPSWEGDEEEEEEDLIGDQWRGPRRP